MRDTNSNEYTMKHNKKLEQRTFLQERFEILIKKQKAGTATFNELTELDEIVNRNATIRDRILEEMQEFNGPSKGVEPQEFLLIDAKEPFNLWKKVKSFIGRIFTFILGGINNKAGEFLILPDNSSSRIVITL